MDDDKSTSYHVIEKQAPGGTVRVHIPTRTPEQQTALLTGLDRALQKACPGRRLIMPERIQPL